MRFATAAAVLGSLASAASAQQARELTFFSNPGFSGARFTVTGPRTTLNIPFTPRSAMVQGGGSWQVCGSRDYRNPCQSIAQNQRELRLGFSRVASARPTTPAATSPWREITRLNVRDRATSDSVPIADRDVYREIMICGERNVVRIRRAEAQLDRRQWQRLFVPVTLSPGQCSNAIDLLGDDRRITGVRFDYEAWSPGWRGGTIVVRALPYVRPQPR